MADEELVYTVNSSDMLMRLIIRLGNTQWAWLLTAPGNTGPVPYDWLFHCDN